MLNKILKTGLLLVTISSPLLAGAFLENTESILNSVLYLVRDFVIPIVFTLALLLFFWGVVKYIRSEGQGKEDGRKIMIWGVVALFVMSSIWGLVSFLRDELDLGSGTTNMQIPRIGN